MDGLYQQIRITLHQLWQRRWLALAVAWGLCVLGWFGLAFVPNSYESTAHVAVEARQILPSQVGMPQPGLADMTRLKQTLTSTENLTKVVRRTDLNGRVSSDRDLAAEVEMLRQSIKVTATPENIFEISATAKVSGFSNAQNAKLSAAIVQNLIDLFVSDNLSGDRTEANQSLTFLDNEVHKREQELQQAEQRRADFEQRYLGVLPGEGSIEQRMAAARSELSNVDQQVIQAQTSMAALRSQLASTPPTLPGVGGENSGSAQGQLAALEGQLGQYQARGWTDSHPDVIAVKQQIERLRPIAAREPRGAGGMQNPSYVSIQSMIAERQGALQAAMTRKAQLQSDMAQLTSKEASEPGVAAEQDRLNRDYDAMKRQYDKIVEDRDQVRLRSDIATKTDSFKFRVIDPPSQPTLPKAPNRPLLLTVILFAAIAGGIGAAFVAIQLRRTFPTQNKLAEATGLPVLGTVHEVLTKELRAHRRQRLVWLGGGAGALFAGYAVLMLVEFWQRSAV
ncbi:MAG TPA: XrtA system polysaccharide chain length determinant [Allosphingosinicella sp.]|jgi:polysaccharide chain length determinant protein (PEP-CTERM system associated)|nr:XrtA system polysaccharide chain length determinant [Allosphingosinicella sp.]